MTPAIRIEGLRKSLKADFWRPTATLLDGVSLDVPERSITGFVGHNGAGKSTTIKVLIGAIRRYEGRAELFGKPPTDSEVRQRMGYLPELPRLPPTLTPVELMAAHATLARVSPAEQRGRIDELLTRVELNPVRERRVGRFSKGMQQRLAVALAFLGNPDVLILDEPMSGLDPAGRRVVRELITAARRRGATVLLSSHVLPDVEALCDRVCVIHEGRTVASGLVGDVFRRQRLGTDIVFQMERTEIPGPEELGLATEVIMERRGDHFAAVLGEGQDPVDAAVAIRAAGAMVVSIESRSLPLEDELAHFVTTETVRGAS